MDSTNMPDRRKLPKLMACMTKTSLENMRNKALFNLNVLDAKGIRRKKMALYQCIIFELREAGYAESAAYIQDLIFDNEQLITEDEIGIVVDIRKNEEYLEHISEGLQRAEKEKVKENTKRESLELLKLAMFYAEKGKGILWLSEKFFLAAIAVSSQYLLDGGRQKAACKYHYAKFLLEKFPGANTDESLDILSDVRVAANGRDWDLYEVHDEVGSEGRIPLFVATALMLHRVLLTKAAALQNTDIAKAERLSRLAERRAKDAGALEKVAEAIISMGVCQLAMNNFNNSLNSFKKAFKIYTGIKNVEGLCETRMHLASVLQRLGDHKEAAMLLTEMGTLAMQHNLRRHLGRALHLLGELHLRRERPELGTQHLAEAFSCFMGYGYHDGDIETLENKPEVCCTAPNVSHMMVYTASPTFVIYYEEAEQARLTMAVSSGQELMPSYFSLLRQSETCAISRMQIIEWKLSKTGWWMKNIRHNFLPCLCPIHQRTPLDVLRTKLRMKELKEKEAAIAADTSTIVSHSKLDQNISFHTLEIVRTRPVFPEPGPE